MNYLFTDKEYKTCIVNSLKKKKAHTAETIAL